MMKKYNVSISEDLEKEIDRERKRRYLESIPETMRVLLSEHMAEKKT
jgi:Arc/MetJ-type ribon-helix-helix transcriptional regulator